MVYLLLDPLAVMKMMVAFLAGCLVVKIVGCMVVYVAGCLGCLHSLLYGWLQAGCLVFCIVCCMAGC